MASFSVVSNVSAQNAQANLNTTNIGLQRTLTRLSSGFRINQAGDDAAGLAVANAYRSEQAVLNQGIRNANDGLSTLQIKNGALDNISTLLDRLATLASQSASAGFGGNRTTLNNEFADVVAEIAREVTVAGLGTAQGFSVFVSGGGSGTVGGTIGAADTTTLGIASLSVATAAGAATAVGAITTAVGTVGTVVGSVGSLQNRLQYSISLAQYQAVNTKAAESRIRDANVAEESANLTRYNILTQSGLASLAQANQQSSAVLALLR
ncbi:MAG: flagellin FliC [Acidobacteria bacterium]|nr:flagellin FliC [Acidobacteriota bacterium]